MKIKLSPEYRKTKGSTRTAARADKRAIERSIYGRVIQSTNPKRKRLPPTAAGGVPEGGQSGGAAGEGTGSPDKSEDDRITGKPPQGYRPVRGLRPQR